MAWGLFGSFWCRVLRLTLAYSPKLRRKVPWLMSVSCSSGKYLWKKKNFLKLSPHGWVFHNVGKPPTQRSCVMAAMVLVAVIAV